MTYINISNNYAATDNVVMASILTESQKYLFSLINYIILCGVISVFGTVTNVINIVIFCRQGLNTTINISFFSLAISDLASLVLQQLFNVFVNPLFVDLNLPMIYTDVQFLTTAIKRELFAKITCFITVYITAERCFCIAFPLHIKQMITPKRTTTIILCIYILTMISGVPLYCTLYIDWQFDKERNKTILALAFRENKDLSETVVYVLHAAFGVLSFLAVVVFTLVLIHKLRQKSDWRKLASLQQERSESMSSKDRSTISMVVVIASILIICYTPSVMLFLTTMFVPEFSIGGAYYNLFYSLWTFGVLMENVNSSVNIFLYCKMSTKYRNTLKELFSRCLPRDVQDTLVH